jgi:hypothetical protein
MIPLFQKHFINFLYLLEVNQSLMARTLMKRSTSAQEEPAHWDLLSPSDQLGYIELQNRAHEDVSKSRKGERLSSFTDWLRRIRYYTEQSEGDEWKRELVCGLAFMRDCLAINIRQLCVLLGKCKSSMNGSLQQLGYTAQPPLSGNEAELIQKIPYLSRDISEMKKWTIRKNGSETCLIEPPFLVPMPSPMKTSATVNTTEVNSAMESQFPCPVKCRYKYLDMIRHSIAIQTEFIPL